jgi:two-component system, NtrC family, sensor kinase
MNPSATQFLQSRTMNAAVVNISGRQRMLSQRAAMFALRLTMPELSEDDRQTMQNALRMTIDLMEASHNSLLAGNTEWDLPGNSSPEVHALYFEPPLHLDQLVRTYIRKVKALCDLSDEKIPCLSDIEDILNLAHEKLLNALGQLVLQYQIESDAQHLNAQAQLIQAEKMSTLGKLVAGVAHEINNPVNFIHGNLAHAKEYANSLSRLIELYRNRYPDAPEPIQRQIEAIDLDFVVEDFVNVLNSMQIGSDRIREIVRSLLSFSHQDKTEPQPANLHEGIDSTLLILKPQLNGSSNNPKIKVVKNYQPLPPVDCYTGQLNQVFMNILSNAIDALINAQDIVSNPTITILTKQLDRNRVCVQITDNGVGIPPNVQERIFDSFFTTKPVGKGTGLGLAISHHIVVEKHAGQLRCLSQPSLGTEFFIEIPIKWVQPV